LDSYKLIPWRRVLASLVLGIAAAGLAFLANRWLFDRLAWSRADFSRYVAPAIEEALKLFPVLILIARARIGFVVDAAIHGFAVGAGFALLENLSYLLTLSQAGVWLWIVRGFGTAILHGSTTSAAAIVAKELVDHRNFKLRWAAWPGFALAIVVHSAYNHFLLPPVAAALLVLVTSPLFLLLVFQYGERKTRSWLGSGFDTQAQLLELVMSDRLPSSPVGRYLESLRHAFEGPVLADLLCLLRVQLELSIRAKGILLAREAGIEVEVGDDAKAKLEELRYLEHSVGVIGRRALHPVLRQSRRELWQIYSLSAK
jgi:hypothetical protein